MSSIVQSKTPRYNFGLNLDAAYKGFDLKVFFDPVNSLVSGSMTEQQWIDGIKSASDQMRANIIE